MSLDTTIGELLGFWAFLYCLGLAGIAWAYFGDRRNGFDRPFFKLESENNFVNYVGMPTLIGLMIAVALAFVASPFLAFM